MKIGFIGVGIMGKSMVRNLMKAGFDLTIYTRTKEKVLDVINEGAKWADSIKECVKEQDVVITIVGYPNDVEEVYFSEGGIFDNAKEGAVLIDMTTNSPKLAVRIYNEACKRGFLALDAPVTGGDIAAKSATLTIMVGGDEPVYKKVIPVFEAMGDHIVYEGVAGNGQHTKMANQIVIAGTISGVCEGIAYAKNMGLNVETMMETIQKGSAASSQLTNLAPRILKDDYTPGFFVKHFIKDMKLAIEEAREKELELNILEDVLKMYEKIASEGAENLGTQVLIKYYDN